MLKCFDLWFYRCFPELSNKTLFILKLFPLTLNGCRQFFRKETEQKKKEKKTEKKQNKKEMVAQKQLTFLKCKKAKLDI